MRHFVDEVNNKNIIFWATGNQSIWTIKFVDKSENNKAFREFTSTINVTDGKLYLTKYDDLTMSAQFEDERIPAEHNSDIIIQLENGLYNLRIRQLFAPEAYDNEMDGKVNFEVVIEDTEKETEKIGRINWWSE